MLPFVVAFFILSGCTTSTTTDSLKTTASKSFAQTLSGDLPLLADQILIEIPYGNVTFTASDQRAAVAKLTVPLEQQSILADAKVTWEIVERTAELVVSLPEGVLRDQVRLDLELSCSPDQLPAKTVVRIGEGEANLFGFRGHLDLTVSEGACTLQETVLEGDSRVVAGGAITADLVEVLPGIQEFEAGFGMIELGLPSDAGVRIVAQAPMGEIFSDLNFSYLEPASEAGVGATLAGWLNAGGSELRLLVKSGNITLYPR